MSTTPPNPPAFILSVIYEDNPADCTYTAVDLQGHPSSFVQPIGDA